MNRETGKFRWLAMTVSLILIMGCEKVTFETTKIPVKEVSFENDIQPILNAKCTSCHPPAKDLDLTTDNSYASLVPDYVSPSDSTDPQGSGLYIKLTGTSHSPVTTSLDKQNILTWISQGVPDN